MRPIDADKLKKELAPYEENDFSQQMDVILKIVDMQPAITPQNEPLSIEQLREMDREPVYLIVDDGYEPLEMWALIDVLKKDHIVLINNIGGMSAYYSDDGLKQDHITVYRRPAEGEEDNNETGRC